MASIAPRALRWRGSFPTGTDTRRPRKISGGTRALLAAPVLALGLLSLGATPAMADPGADPPMPPQPAPPAQPTEVQDFIAAVMGASADDGASAAGQLNDPGPVAIAGAAVGYATSDFSTYLVGFATTELLPYVSDVLVPFVEDQASPIVAKASCPKTDDLAGTFTCISEMPAPQQLSCADEVHGMTDSVDCPQAAQDALKAKKCADDHSGSETEIPAECAGVSAEQLDCATSPPPATKDKIDCLAGAGTSDPVADNLDCIDQTPGPACLPEQIKTIVDGATMLAGTVLDTASGLADDADHDGVSNLTDNCPTTANPQQENADGDPLGDACDPKQDPTVVQVMGIVQTVLDTVQGYATDVQGVADDTDGDGHRNLGDDNCPLISNPDQQRGDGNLVGGDACDPKPLVLDPYVTPILDSLPTPGDVIGEVMTIVGSLPTPQDIQDQVNGIVNPIADPTIALVTGTANDVDGDTKPNQQDNCPAVANQPQTDSDGDGLGDACDPDQLALNQVHSIVDPVVSMATDTITGKANDTDGDGVPNATDNCPLVANADQKNSNANSEPAVLGDACDPQQLVLDPAHAAADPVIATATATATDPDSDGKPTVDPGSSPGSLQVDNCPLTANPGQEKGSPGGMDRPIGTACDPDPDGDLFLSPFGLVTIDNCPNDPNGVVLDPATQKADVGQKDTDADGTGDACDADDDNDGVPDDIEAQRGTDPLKQDTDGDGVKDGVDNCGTSANADQKDTDADGTGNACDNDDDNDGLSDAGEAEIGTDPLKPDTDGDGVKDGKANANDPPADNCPLDPNPSQLDSDHDGIGDACDPTPFPKRVIQETTILRAPKASTVSRLAVFTFAGTDPASQFQCKLDRAGYRPCVSPFVKFVKPGRHVLLVRSAAPSGLVDPTPAVHKWRVKKKRR
jgi:hypothetical protein